MYDKSRHDNMHPPLTLSRFLLFVKKIRLVPAFGFSCPVFLPFVINNYVGFDGYYFIIVLAVVLANLFVIPRFSYYGAAMVTVLTEGLVLVITTFFIFRLIKIFPSLTHFPKTIFQLISLVKKKKGNS